MGLSLTATIVETPDGIRVDLEGEGGDLLVRRRGEALNALQQIVASVFRDEMPEGQRIGVDCLGFRQGKDAELRKMAQFLADKAVTAGAPQEIGPAEPLRAADRAHGRDRARRRHVGEHRRRVHEDGHHRRAEVAPGRPFRRARSRG